MAKNPSHKAAKVNMKKIFFSYAKEDSAVVTRVYEDLIRAGGRLHVWCYEKTSEYGAHFREEYAEHLQNSDYVLLFDSSHARTSAYVKDEMDLCSTHRHIQLIICLLEEEGAWRQKELFKGQNYIVYFDLTQYEEGMKALCKQFRVAYRPKFVVPRDLDFDRELRESRQDFSHQERQDLLNQYAYFRSVHTSKPNVAKAQLRVLIEQYLDGEEGDIRSPYLALAVLQTEKGDWQGSIETYDRILARWPAEPRGWAGRAYGLFELGRYEKAASSLQHCLDLIKNSGDAAHKDHVGEVVYNLSTAYLAAGKPLEAASVQKHMPEPMASRPENSVLAGRIFLAIDDINNAESALRKAAASIQDGETCDPGVLPDLAEGLHRIWTVTGKEDLVKDLHRFLAYALDHFPDNPHLLRCAAVLESRKMNPGQALTFYEKALKRQPDDLRLLAEGALLCHHMGEEGKLRNFIDRTMVMETPPADRAYFLGLIHYLAGRRETADYYFSKCRDAPTTRDWPHYQHL
jgi:tetratricopeptide (TPR) repeat protein